MQTETKELLIWWTEREDALKAQAVERGLVLPERLTSWSTWIGDPILYLNELANFVETHPSPQTNQAELPLHEHRG